MKPKEARQRLRKAGFNRNVKIPEEDWKNLRRECTETSLSYARIRRREKGTTFRDDKPRNSLHLKDLRDRDTDKRFVAELERYNPRHHPLRHLAADFTYWTLRYNLTSISEAVSTAVEPKGLNLANLYRSFFDR